MRLLTVLCLLLAPVFAQQNQIEILNADVLDLEKSPDGEIRRLTGNVALKQDSITLYCDVATQRPEVNLVEARGNVRMLMGKVTLLADEAEYDGNSRIARCRGNIRLIRDNTVLRTPSLTYHRTEGYGYYDRGGTLTDSANVLTSRTGYYYTQQDIAYFKKDVVYHAGKDYVLRTDTLKYEVKRDIAHFVDTTRVVNADSTRRMYTERGWYDAKGKHMLLWQNATYRDTSYTLRADTLYYHQPADSGWAACGIRVWNRDTTAHLAADRALFLKKKGRLWLWNDPWLVQYLQRDTLSLFADTLLAHEDSLQGIHLLEAHRRVRFRTGQLQAIAQHLQLDRKDSILTLTQDPVCWSGENQVSGDTLRLWLKDSRPDSLWVIGHAFLVSRADSVRFYNQIKGKTVLAHFVDNQLSRMRVEGNVESIYFMKEGKKMVGMNLSYCSRMLAWFENNEPVRIKLEVKPNGTFFPIHEVYLDPKLLDGFNYRIAEKPVDYLQMGNGEPPR